MLQHIQNPHLPNPNRPLVELIHPVNNRPIHCGLDVTSLYPTHFKAIDYILSVEAKQNFIENHPNLKYIEKPKAGERSQIAFNQRTVHGHPLGGSQRSDADINVKIAVARGCRVLDIGGSSWRNLVSNDVNEYGNYVNRKLCERVHSMAPCIEGGRDEHRVENLKFKVKTSPNRNEMQAMLDAYTCGHVAGAVAEAGCVCGTAAFDVVNMTDSFYYTGVMTHALNTLIRCPGSIAFCSGFDYHAAWLANKHFGRCADGESVFEFVATGIKHAVKGNLAPYIHAIFRTDGQECFTYKYRDFYFIFERIRVSKNGDLEYCTWKITKVAHAVEHAHQITGPLLFSPYADTKQEVTIDCGAIATTAVRDFSHFVAAKTRKPIRDMTASLATSITNVLECFSSLAVSKREKIKYIEKTDQYSLTICVETFLGFPWAFKTYVVDAAPVESLFSSFLYRRQLGEMVRITRAAFSTLTAVVPEGEVPGPKHWGLSITKAADVQKVTTVLAQRVAADLLDTVMTTQSKKTLDIMMTNPFSYKNGPNREWLTFFLTFLSVFTFVYYANLFLTSVPKVVANDMLYDQQTPNEWVPMVLVSIIVTTFFHWCKKRNSKVGVVIPPEWYPTDCEHNDANCDLSNIGRHNPKYKVRGELLKNFPKQWTCDAKQKVGPVVVGPRFAGFENVLTGTQNHSCARSTVSAVKRMVGLKCSYDPVVMNDFIKYVREFHFPRYIAVVSQEGFKVDVDEWISKYPEVYRDEIRRLENDCEYYLPANGSNKMFCKTDEINVPTFDEENQHDPAYNKIKKRAICDPDHAEKAKLNPTCYFLSKLSSLANPFYNVGRNYMQTCKFLETFEEIADPIYFAADGSGFDMTQYPIVNELFYELVEQILTHVNAESDQDISVPLIMQTFRAQLKLKVKAFNGDLKFEALGRGSGHGWTTVANTNLNIWYYSYLMYKAGIEDTAWKGVFQGDDSLMCTHSQNQAQVEFWKDQFFLAKDEDLEYGLGQICKKIVWGDITEMDFISCHFYRLFDGDLRMVRIAGRILPTIGLSVTVPKPHKNSEMTDDQIDEYYRDPEVIKIRNIKGSEKALNGLDWSVGIFWEQIYMKMLEVTGAHPRNEKLQTDYEKRKTHWNYDQAIWKCNDEDFGAYRHWFCMRYDVTQSDIDDFLSCVANVTTANQVVYHKLVDAVYMRDNM